MTHGRAIAAAVIVLIAATTAGCAIGRTRDGADMLGFRAGDITPETAGEYAGLLPYPFNIIAKGALAVFGVGGAVAGASAVARRRGERAGWDERDIDQERRDADYYAGARDFGAAPARNVANV